MNKKCSSNSNIWEPWKALTLSLSNLPPLSNRKRVPNPQLAQRLNHSETRVRLNKRKQTRQASKRKWDVVARLLWAIRALSYPWTLLRQIRKLSLSFNSHLRRILSPQIKLYLYIQLKSSSKRPMRGSESLKRRFRRANSKRRDCCNRKPMNFQELKIELISSSEQMPPTVALSAAECNSASKIPHRLLDILRGLNSRKMIRNRSDFRAMQVEDKLRAKIAPFSALIQLWVITMSRCKRNLCRPHLHDRKNRSRRRTSRLLEDVHRLSPKKSYSSEPDRSIWA